MIYISIIKTIRVFYIRCLVELHKLRVKMNDMKIILEYCDIAAALWYNHVFHTLKQDILIQVYIRLKPDTIHIQNSRMLPFMLVCFVLSINMNEVTFHLCSQIRISILVWNLKSFFAFLHHLSLQQYFFIVRMFWWEEDIPLAIIILSFIITLSKFNTE